MLLGTRSMTLLPNYLRGADLVGMDREQEELCVSRDRALITFDELTSILSGRLHTPKASPGLSAKVAANKLTAGAAVKLAIMDELSSGATVWLGVLPAP